MARKSKRDRKFPSVEHLNPFALEEEVKEQFDNFEEAVGVFPAVGVKSIGSTKAHFWIVNGFTQKYLGMDPLTGLWYSAFYNPTTKKYSGGKESSRNGD